MPGSDGEKEYDERGERDRVPLHEVSQAEEKFVRLSHLTASPRSTFTTASTNSFRRRVKDHRYSEESGTATRGDAAGSPAKIKKYKVEVMLAPYNVGETPHV